METIERQNLLIGKDCWRDVEGASITVAGLGKSGVSAANALARRGARVLAVDDKPEAELQGSLKTLDSRVEVHFGASDGSGYKGPAGRRGDLFVVSPGLMPHSRRFRDIQALAAEILSEVELFYRLDRAALDGRGHPIAAISGTDGKTTTTLLTAHLLQAGGHRVVVGGNIGEPLCDFLDRGGVGDGLHPDDVIVAEVSAFQLATCSRFRPRLAVVTNIALDHQDWFQNDLDAYVAAKVKVADAMGPGDTLMVNGDDEELAAYRGKLGAGVPFSSWTFSTRGVPERGFGLDGEVLTWSLARDARVPILPMAELGSLGAHPITGLHNAENALGACGMVLAFGVPLEAVRQGLRTFELPAHRLQPVGTIGSVRFVDDSKATNPHAAIAGLKAVTVAPGERLVWIGGGSSKDADFGPLAQVVAQKAAAAILIGQTAEAIAAALPAGLPVHRCERLEDAVPLGLQLAEGAGVVLLSPACASFDMFRGYAHRGEVFATAVKRLQTVLAGR